jgi:hypothetical protein
MTRPTSFQPDFPSKMVIASLLAIALGGALGCGRNSSPGGTAVGRGPRKIVSNGEHYFITLETSPDPIPMNQPFEVRFTILPKTSPASELGVQVDARMPAHFHGMNRVPKLTHQQGGSWKAEGLVFHMPGLWELYFDITEGGTTERAQIDVELK